MALSACAIAKAPTPDQGPQTAYERAADGTPVVLSAKELLPADMQEGSYFKVADAVRNDGVMNTYTVTSKFGTVEAYGDDQLRYRENEFEVLGGFEEYGANQANLYVFGVIGGAQNYVEGALQLIVWPIRQIIELPDGIYDYGATIVEMTRERRTFYEDSYAEELIGFSQAKRELSGRAGVDPYTQNPAMKERLNELSWPSWAGGMTANIGTAPVSGIAGFALTAASTPENMHLVNLDLSPEDLRIANRDAMKKMGVDESLREEFLQQPWYSPRQQTILISSLQKIDGAAGRPEFIRAALAANDQDEAFTYQRLAELLRAYHEYQSPLVEIVVKNGVIVARAKDGSWVAPLLMDYGRWTPGTRTLTEQLETAMPTSPPPATRVYWITGRLAPDMADALKARGWQLEENIFPRHLLAYEYQQLMAIREALNGQRITPRIGD